MAVPQQFCVRWNSHLGSLGAAFPQLLAGGRFVDVTLACEGRQLSCHRLVLAACSTFFESLLGENPCKHPIIILKDVRFWELQALVDFMYKGEVNVTQDGLQDLLKCAETLQIRGLSGADSAFKNLPMPTTPVAPVKTESNEKSPAQETSTPIEPESPAVPHTPILKNDIPENDNSPDSSSVRSDDMLDDAEMNLVVKEEYCIEEESHNKQTGDDFAMANVSCEYDDLNSTQESEHNMSMEHGLSDGMSSGGEGNTPSRRVRRSEAILKQAADCVSRGQTFQHVSDMFSIPISTIRFFMARKGILPRRKRGRSSGTPLGGSRSGSPLEPPYHIVHYKLPEIRPKLV